MTNSIKVLVYPVGAEPVVKNISDSLSDMQDLVGGMIQIVDLGAMTHNPKLEGYDLVCNEEGKLLGLPANRVLPFDIIAGQFYISKAGDEGETVALTNKDISDILFHFDGFVCNEEEVEKMLVK